MIVYVQVHSNLLCSLDVLHYATLEDFSLFICAHIPSRLNASSKYK